MPEPTRFPETTQEYLEWVAYWEKSPASYKPDKFYIKAAEKMNYDVELVKEFLAKRRGSLAQEVVEESKASPSSLDWDWGEDELYLDRIEEKPSEKQPLSAEEKPQCNETAEIIKTPVEAMNTPKEDPQGLQGWDAIVKYLEAGVALIGVYPDKIAIAKGERYDKAFTSDKHIIENLWNGKDKRILIGKLKPGEDGIKRFRFKPSSAGWLCLDIDRKNGRDCLEEFKKYCESRGKTPRIFKDLPFNFPCWVESPNSGYHLYFEYTGQVRQKNCLAETQVEVKYESLLMAAGSKGFYEKSDEFYILHGSFDKIPPLPDFIRKDIMTPHEAKKTIPQKYDRKNIQSWLKKQGQRGTDNRFPLEKIIEKTNEKYPREKGSRNHYVHLFSLYAGGAGYSFDEILSCLFNLSGVNDFDKSFTQKDMEKTIENALKYLKRG